MAHRRAKAIDFGESSSMFTPISTKELLGKGGLSREDLEHPDSRNPLMRTEAGRAMIAAKQKLANDTAQMKSDVDMMELSKALESLTFVRNYSQVSDANSCTTTAPNSPRDVSMRTSSDLDSYAPTVINTPRKLSLGTAFIWYSFHEQVPKTPSNRPNLAGFDAYPGSPTVPNTPSSERATMDIDIDDIPTLRLTDTAFKRELGEKDGDDQERTKFQRTRSELVVDPESLSHTFNPLMDDGDIENIGIENVDTEGAGGSGRRLLGARNIFVMIYDTEVRRLRHTGKQDDASRLEVCFKYLKYMDRETIGETMFMAAIGRIRDLRLLSEVTEADGSKKPLVNTASQTSGQICGNGDRGEAAKHHLAKQAIRPVLENRTIEDPSASRTVCHDMDESIEADVKDTFRARFRAHIQQGMSQQHGNHL